MAMQGYGTAPSRNKANASSAPMKGLIEKEMMMAKPSTVKKIAKKKAKKAVKSKK